MDPLRDHCIVKDSFDSYNDLKTQNIPKYTEIFVGSPRTRRNSILSPSPNKEREFQNEISERIDISLADPFTSIKTLFHTRSSLILADIDTIFNFSFQEDGYLVPQIIDEDYSYAILDKDKGFLDYMQYRLPASTGYIDCLDEEKPNDFLNMNCDNGLVDISPEGVDLVLSNKLHDYKETVLTVLKVCRKGGRFISKIDSTTNLKYIYPLVLYFDSITFFKPFLSNLNEDVTYLIAEGFGGNSFDLIDFEKINIPAKFISYVNNYYKSWKELKDKLKNNSVLYNMYKCKALMNIF